MTQIPDAAVQAAASVLSRISNRKSYHKDALDILIAALPHLPLGFEVEQLVWSEYDDEQGAPDRWDAEAASFGVFYSIELQHDSFRVVFDHEAVGAIGAFHTIDEAKAAAQADFERRVRECITLTNEGTKLVEAPTKEERHANKARNIIINQTSDDLENIINGHDPEQSILNNDVWDRLDKMACEIEALAKPVDVAAVLSALTDGIKEANTMLLEHKDEYHDYEDSTPESESISHIYHHLCGTLIHADDIRALSAEPAQGEHLPQDVINLVIAAREAFDTGIIPEGEECNLDSALKPFSDRVPYENEPEAHTPEEKP